MTSARRPPRLAPTGRADAGTALVGSLVGVTIFLVFLFTAVQLLTALYATSTVTAVATDAARSVAAREVDHASGPAVGTAEHRAEAAARAALGGYSHQVRFDWSLADGTVRLRVRATNVRLALAHLPGLSAFTKVDRTVVIETEDG